MSVRAARSQPVILVVDDGKLHVMLLQLALTQLGYGVHVASSSEARSDAADRDAVAILLTHDLAEASAVLRAFGSARPSIAMAFAPAGSHGAAQVLAAGFDIALTRPIDFAALDSALRSRMKRPATGTQTRAPGRGGREGAA